MPSPSLIDFLQKEVLKRLPHREILQVLELGAGADSVFSSGKIKKKVHVTAIDNDSAIVFSKKDSTVEYYHADIADPGLLNRFNLKFDLIFDAHCFHCITSAEKRRNAFANVVRLLQPDGLFAAEMMVQSKRQQVDVEARYVPESFDLEEEILASGLKIIFFVISRDLVFELNEEHGIECDLVRVIATK